MADYTFYDLASKGRCASWTPNPWKSKGPSEPQNMLFI